MAVPDKAEATGPWDNPALATFREWEPVLVDQCLKMSADPWTSGVLPRKDVELISLAVNAACTNLSAGGTRRHIRGALDSRRDPRRDPDGPQDRVSSVDPYVQPRRTHSVWKKPRRPV